MIALPFHFLAPFSTATLFEYAAFCAVIDINMKLDFFLVQSDSIIDIFRFTQSIAQLLPPTLARVNTLSLIISGGYEGWKNKKAGNRLSVQSTIC